MMSSPLQDCFNPAEDNVTNFDKWKQNLKPEDLVQDFGEEAKDNDEARYQLRLDCENCPVKKDNKCHRDFWTDCGLAFLNWARMEARDG